MTKDFNDKLSDLRAAQTETHTLLKGLTKKVDQYIEIDDVRHNELIEFRIESSKNLAIVAEIVKEIKSKHDVLVNETVPKLQTEQAGQKASLNIHTWLLRAVIGVTLIAVLGGTVSSLGSFNFSRPSAVSTEGSPPPSSISVSSTESHSSDAGTDEESAGIVSDPIHAITF